MPYLKDGIFSSTLYLSTCLEGRMQLANHQILLLKHLFIFEGLPSKVVIKFNGAYCIHNKNTDLYNRHASYLFYNIHDNFWSVCGK